MTYDDQNIFAKIIRGDIPSKKVFEDEATFAFQDISPAAPVHVLVLPKGLYTSFDDFCVKADAATVGKFFQTVQRLAAELGVDASGYRLITNHGADASQSVPHFHVHLIGGRALGGLVPDDLAVR